jgi:hypothetical protein
LTSNFPWNYGHETIPRHLRDVVVSEYGVAALRGLSDRDCVAALLSIADSRFQPALLHEAQRAGKLERGYRIPEAFASNTPAALAAALAPLRRLGFFSEFPFGTDFTAEEIVLLKALQRLDASTATLAGRATALLGAVAAPVAAVELAPYLERLRLDAPRGWRARLSARLVANAVRAVRGARQ